MTGYPHIHPHTGPELWVQSETHCYCRCSFCPVPPSTTREINTSIKIWATFDTTILSYYRDLTTVKVLSDKHMISSMFTLYRVFDNDLQRVGAYCLDQKASLELKTGGIISPSLVHFEKYLPN